MHDALLCLDSGTTRIKAAVYNVDGELLGFAEADNTVLRRDGTRITQDMEETRLLNLAVLRDCIAQAGVRIGAMIISGQGDGLWPLDANCCPFMDGIVWLDGRAADLLGQLEAEGVVEAIHQMTLSKPTTASQTVLLRWLSENHPNDYDRLTYALRLKDWLFLCLTGQLMTEHSNILPVWGDPRTGQLCPEIPKFLGLDKGLSVVPEVRKIKDCHAPILSDVAGELGLDYTFPCYIGPSDVQATAIGLGVGTRSGINSCSIFGTGSIHVGYALSPEAWQNLPAGSIIQPYALGEGFICMHPGFNGTSIFGHIERFTNSPRQGHKVKIAPSEIIVLPFFEEGGERAPFTSAAAKGAIFGLRASSTTDQIRWAARESLAFMGRMSQDMFSAGDVVAVGGGLSQDREFMQFFSNCLGRDLHCFSSANVGLLGLAQLLLSVRSAGANSQLTAFTSGNGVIYRPETNPLSNINRKYRQFVQLAKMAITFWEAERDTADFKVSPANIATERSFAQLAEDSDSAISNKGYIG